jgi:acetyl esterase/lipase
VATELAALGWSAASIDYCLPPVGTSGYPTEVGQVRNAISYFVDHAAEFRIDPRRIAVWGASAGASLALDSTTLMDRDGAEPIVAAVGWSGAYDLGSTQGVAVPIARIVDNYLGCSAAEGTCRTTAAGASAIRHILRGSTPPMYLANSTHELMPLEQLDAMRRALVSAGVPVSIQVIPGSRHAMAYTNIAFCPTVSFLERYLGATAGECQIPSRVVISDAGVRRLTGHTPSARRAAESAASAASAGGRVGGHDARKHGVGAGSGGGDFGIHAVGE